MTKSDYPKPIPGTWGEGVEGRLTALEDARSWLEKNAAVPEFRAAYDAEEAADYVCWCHELKGDGIQTPRSLFIQQLKARAEAAEAERDRLRVELAESTRSMMLATTRYVRAEATITRLTAPRTNAELDPIAAEAYDAMAERAGNVHRWNTSTADTREQWHEFGADIITAFLARRLKAPQGEPPTCGKEWHTGGNRMECARRQGHGGLCSIAPDVVPVAAPVVEPPKPCPECVALKERVANWHWKSDNAQVNGALDYWMGSARRLEANNAILVARTGKLTGDYDREMRENVSLRERLAVAERERDYFAKAEGAALKWREAHRCPPTATAEDLTDEHIEELAKVAMNHFYGMYWGELKTWRGVVRAVVAALPAARPRVSSGGTPIVPDERRATVAWLWDRVAQYPTSSGYHAFVHELVTGIVDGRHVELLRAGEYDDMAGQLDAVLASRKETK